ncbi:MAG: YaaL family protein [Bacillota bacterium]|nr:YaaL family protein [Bacillota bacterium]
MFFRQKGKLRKEFDEKLLNNLNEFKQDWQQQTFLLDKSFDPSEEVICQTKLAEAKYFLMLKEAKQRNITLRKY